MGAGSHIQHLTMQSLSACVKLKHYWSKLVKDTWLQKLFSVSAAERNCSQKKSLLTERRRGESVQNLFQDGRVRMTAGRLSKAPALEQCAGWLLLVSA